MRSVVGIAVLGLLFAGTSFARLESSPPSGDSVSQEADSQYQKKDWAAAAKSYDALVKSDPKNGRAWFRLGVSLQFLGKLPEAVDAYLKAEAIAHNAGVMVNLAIATARMGRREEALGWLEKAAAAGYAQPEVLSSDPDLAPLRDEPRFKAVAERVEGTAHPCAAIPETHQFDFWVGKWDVRTPAGDPAGTNTIERILGGCALVENWTGAHGGTGKSLNFYDKVKMKWQQVWIDDQGDAMEFVDGEYKDSIMSFKSEKTRMDGTKILRRLNFYNLGPDKVRQFSEQSTDGGKSWGTEYDLVYSRVH